MMKSRPAALWLRACLTDPASAPISRPAPWTRSTTSGGGVPSALAMSLTFGWRRATSSRPAAWAAVQPIIPLEVRSLLGDLGHAVVGQDLEGELLVLWRHQATDLGLELVGVHLVHALVLGRDHDVDAVGLVAHVLVDPGQLHLELLGSEADGAEHPDPSGVGDRGDHVAAVGEGEDRELDAERVADLSVHGGLLSVWWGTGSSAMIGAQTPARPSRVRPTRAARPRRRGRRGPSRVEPPLHGQPGEQGLDQHGQLLGVGRGIGPRPRRSSRRAGGRCSAGPRRCGTRSTSATSGSRAARSHSSCSSSDQRAGLGVGGVGHVGPHRGQLAGGRVGHRHLGQQHGEHRVLPGVEEGEQEPLLASRSGRRPRPRSGRRPRPPRRPTPRRRPGRRRARRPRPAAAPASPPSAPPGSWPCPPSLWCRPVADDPCSRHVHISEALCN